MIKSFIILMIAHDYIWFWFSCRLAPFHVSEYKIISMRIHQSGASLSEATCLELQLDHNFEKN